jgi:hypothetical protein
MVDLPRIIQGLFAPFIRRPQHLLTFQQQRLLLSCGLVVFERDKLS